MHMRMRERGNGRMPLGGNCTGLVYYNPVQATTMDTSWIDELSSNFRKRKNTILITIDFFPLKSSKK